MLTLKTHSHVKDASFLYIYFILFYLFVYLFFFFASRPHPQHVVAVRKIPSAEDDHLETAVSTSSGINTTSRHEVLPRPSVGMVPILVRYWLQLQNSGCRNTIVPLSLAGTRTVRKLIAFVSANVFKSHGQVATVVAKHEHLDVVDQNNAESIPLNQYQLDYQRQSGLTL